MNTGTYSTYIAGKKEEPKNGEMKRGSNDEVKINKQRGGVGKEEKKTVKRETVFEAEE